MKKTLRFLFIHQNFPGQFVHAAQALARMGHEVLALCIRGRELPGVRCIHYTAPAPARDSEVELARDFEVKVVRGLACAQAMHELKQAGFTPDVVIGHSGWGEPMFCKDVWPSVRFVVFPEFFYSTEGSDFNFDPEFARDSLLARARLRLKNSAQLQALHAADAGYVPTQWQLSQIPTEYQSKMQVIFDGIDTHLVAPAPHAFVQLERARLRLTAQDEVITFVNRNLEPYRGFHIFMRALPEILQRRPQARCLIVGGDEVSYGAPPPAGGSWRQTLLAEVGRHLPMDRVHFLGKLAYQDYLRLIQISSCHVYLTYPFVLSWSCLEVMAAGRIVVGSDTGPVKEVIEHQKNGLLVDFFDTSALAGTVVEVLQNRTAYRPLGDAARRTIVEGYDLLTRCLPAQLALMAGEDRPLQPLGA